MDYNDPPWGGRGQAPDDPDEDPCDAHLSPWCHVELTNGEAVLFGFALRHPATGGLGWLSSSPIMRLDTIKLKAFTRSGRSYLLGRCFPVIDVSFEGEEARVAFDILIGAEAVAMESIRRQDTMWVAACKMSRHLGVGLPRRTMDGTKAFYEEHLAAYVRLREERGWP